tara:strand:- start:764 stop:1282 length:519 start_codon:yes stop_codon:yes gene_type:complete
MTSSFVYQTTNITSIPFSMEGNITIPSHTLFPTEPVVVRANNEYNGRNDTLSFQWSVSPPTLTAADLDFANVVTTTFEFTNSDDHLTNIHMNVSSDAKFQISIKLIRSGQDVVLGTNFTIQKGDNELKLTSHGYVDYNETMYVYDIRVLDQSQYRPLLENGSPKEVTIPINR